jgi:hypothetical protein
MRAGGDANPIASSSSLWLFESRAACGKLRAALPSGIEARWSGPAWNYRPCARHPNSYLNLVATVAESGPKNAEETMMRSLILAGTVLALAAGVTASAMASDRKGDKSGSHVGRFHTAAFGRTHHIRRSSRLAGVRGPESGYPGGGNHGGFIDLGRLGITAACGSYPHRYCGPGYGTPIDAWSY